MSSATLAHKMAPGRQPVLNAATLVELRQRHQTMFAAKAVRRCQQATFTSTSPKELTLRQRLIKKLAALADSKGDAKVSTGLNRRVRYTGTYAPTAAHLSETRHENKETLRDAAATVLIMITSL